MIFNYNFIKWFSTHTNFQSAKYENPCWFRPADCSKFRKFENIDLTKSRLQRQEIKLCFFLLRFIDKPFQMSVHCIENPVRYFNVLVYFADIC